MTITALMKLPAERAPASWKTSVKGETAVVFFVRPGVLYGMLRPMRRTDRM